MTEVFGAVELERHEFGSDSLHVELQIGDSVLVIEAGELPSEVSAWTNSIYVYTHDTSRCKVSKFENQRCVAPIEKGITITSCCVLLWSPIWRLTKHFEVTWVYVQNVDATYAKAMELGATSISEPVEKRYQERQAGFKDPASNTWWVATYKGS